MMLTALRVDRHAASCGSRTRVAGGRRTIAVEDCGGIIELSDEIEAAMDQRDCIEILLTDGGRVAKIYARDAIGRWHTSRPS